MRASEFRGFVAVVVVAIMIGVLFVRLSDADDTTESATATTLPPTTTTVAPTTTVLDAEGALARVCLAAENLRDEVEQIEADAEAGEGSGRPEDGPIQQAAESFYAIASRLPLEPVAVRPEFAAAYEYFREFNEIAAPLGYDRLAILGSPLGERFIALVDDSVTPLGLEETQAFVAFSCGVLLPDDLAIQVDVPRKNTTPIRRAPATTSPPAAPQ